MIAAFVTLSFTYASSLDPKAAHGGCWALTMTFHFFDLHEGEQGRGCSEWGVHRILRFVEIHEFYDGQDDDD